MFRLLATTNAFALLAAAAHAQDAAQLDEVVVVGSRAPARLATDSPAPVDVISAETLAAQGFDDVNRALAFIAPSFNFPRGATGPSAANTRAASLRGLAPDQVLVLVNGKRWHGSSVINFNNVFGRGSVPTDLGAIPMSAVARIEILRDGAAAQYGSDAIAGVINIVLRTDRGGHAAVQAGRTEKGDGGTLTASLGYGLALGERGRLNLNAEIRSRNSTNRAAIDSRYGRLTTEQGDPDSLDVGLAADGQYDLGSGVTLYGDLVYDRRRSTSPAQYRAPTIAPAVYPEGFVPHIRLDMDDAGGAIGLRGAWRGWSWDLSDAPGYNQARFHVHDTTNTSLGTTSPSSFDAGATRYVQNVLDFTASRPLALAAGGNLAVGVEHRWEGFRITSGEPGSYSGAGAQGFPGFNPPTPVDADRGAVAAFVDAELKPVQSLTLAAAARYEHYSDFGDATSGKISALWRPVPVLAVRGTVSTGFRAPSLQQRFFSTVTSQSSNGVLVNIGTFAVDDPVSRALGSSPLKPETSRNLSAGLVLTPLPGLSFTADAFRIKIQDRIALSETLSGTAVTAVLKAAGVTNASQARFFTNAADTTTRGYELTANWRGQLGTEGRLDVTAGYTQTDTDLDHLNANPVLPSLPLLATSSIDLIADALPRNKATLTARGDWRAWSAGLNLARFGSFRAVQVLSEQVFGPVTTVDLTLDYAISPRLKVGVSVLNLGDAYPDKIAERALTQGGGIQYPEVGGLGTNGREYVLRLSSRF
ncbi:TonB-dependent receptor [Caulobacter sp.]|uniref:TonB-dependent receptor plug domain-containing protein n=1 Tax=Caulobacter sp. TaxID=78 RepID=UPI0031D08931